MARSRLIAGGIVVALGGAAGAWWIFAPTPAARLATLLEERRWQAAEALAQQALHDAERDEKAELYRSLGFAHARQDEHPQALDAYRAAHALMPEDPELRRRGAIAMVGIGRMHEEAGEMDAAVARYRAAVASSPEIPHGHRALIAALRALGRTDAAIEALEVALTEGAHDPFNLTHLAWLLASHPDPERRDAERARELAEQLLLHDRTPVSLDTYAIALAALGRYSEAIRYELDAIELAGGEGAPLFAERKARIGGFLEQRPYIEPNTEGP